MNNNIINRVGRFRKISLALWAVAALGTGIVSGCDQNFNAPDPNSPPLDAAVAQTLITGTLANWRYTEYYEFIGIMGRESYTSAGDDPRILRQPIRDAIDATAFIANRPWNSMYFTIKNATNLIEFAAKLPAEQKAGMEGFAKTVWACELARLSGLWYDNGIKIVFSLDRNAPFVPRAQSLAEAARILDEAATNLRAAGSSSFPFNLGTGFDGFGTPQQFLQFNRALRARVAAYQGDYAACLTALSGSFLSESGMMNIGPKFTYSQSPGDVPPGSGRGSGGNPFFQNINAPSIRWWVHKDFVSGNTENTVDRRVTVRTAIPTQIAVPATIFGVEEVTSPRAINIWQEPNSPTDIIRNEELLLLRAEARMLGNSPDLAGALADINRVRAAANAPALTTLGADRNAQISRLLYERRYSLFFEGFRWIDLKRFDRLGDISAERSFQRVSTVGWPRPVNEVPQ
jgi:starch-binding outer membrane protein, SusD/RagB family